ncbi:MAG: phytanoyl-CoA dioxygenase family protein [Planctomycetes bacterium]|nr:phytanoyl-CoA dioxygenase family protein [Planctomycetota bacterium]
MTTDGAPPSNGQPALSDAHFAQFDRDGYVIIEPFLADDHRLRLISEVDAWAAGGIEDAYAPRDDRRSAHERVQLALHEHGLLVSHPPLMAIVETLLGRGFAYHHLHTTRFDAGSNGVQWHHDYMQFPQSNRSHGMVHCFFYLSGLNGTIGDLLLRPGSHRLVVDSAAIGSFGTEDLPGSIAIDRLAPGSLVVVHSALWHARRKKPGGEGRPRYFVDASYCQAGIRWPSDYGDWRSKLRVAQDRGLDRDGRFSHLFDEAHFFDVAEARQRLARENVGSWLERVAPPPVGPV